MLKGKLLQRQGDTVCGLLGHGFELMGGVGLQETECKTAALQGETTLQCRCQGVKEIIYGSIEKMEFISLSSGSKHCQQSGCLTT